MHSPGHFSPAMNGAMSISTADWKTIYQRSVKQKSCVKANFGTVYVTGFHCGVKDPSSNS